MNVICGSEAACGGECNNVGWRWNTAMSGEMAEIIHTNYSSVEVTLSKTVHVQPRFKSKDFPTLTKVIFNFGPAIS